MRGECQSLVIFYAILGIVQSNCSESEECAPLRFCAALKNGEVKLNRDKFCGPPGFLRYCCPSQKKTDSSQNEPKEVEIEIQGDKTSEGSVEFLDVRSVVEEGKSPAAKDKSVVGCEEGETCMPMRFCSFEGKPSRSKFCGPVNFYRYCCPSSA